MLHQLTIIIVFIIRMLMDSEESSSMLVNNEGCYTSYCIELEIDALPVTTLLQSHHINDFEGL